MAEGLTLWSAKKAGGVAHLPVRSARAPLGTSAVESRLAAVFNVPSCTRGIPKSINIKVLEASERQVQSWLRQLPRP